MFNSNEQKVLARILDLDADYMNCVCDYYLSWWDQQFYKFKLIICILLGLYVDSPENPLTLMTINNSTWYGGWDADFVSVGHGFWGNWYYSIEPDGDCWL